MMYTAFMKPLVGLFVILAVLVIGIGTSPDAFAQFAGCDHTSSVSDCITSIGTGIATPGGLAADAEPADVLARVINWLLTMVALLAMIALVWGGIMYIISLGNDQKVETAKKIIMYAIIGLVVVIISLVIITTVQTFLIGNIESAIPIAHAQSTGLNSGIDVLETDVATDDSGIAGRDLSFFDVLEAVILWLLSFVAAIAVAVVIWAGVMYILALGNPEKAEKAKRILLYAIIGLIIVGASFLIVWTVGGLFIDFGGEEA